MSNSKNDSKHYTKTVVNYICELASHDDAGLKLTHSVRRWIIYRRKSHSNKYRHHLKRDANSVSDLVNSMKNNNEYREGKMLERQCEFKEQLSELVTEIFRNTSSVINTTLGPNFYVPPIQLGGEE